MKPILSANVLWSFDQEVIERNSVNDIGFHFTGALPFHRHGGEILLTENAINITGEDQLQVLLGELTELYHGFDDIYTPSLSKNFGMFWKPLRLTLNSGTLLYLIIDYNMLGTKNKVWFDTLTNMLS